MTSNLAITAQIAAAAPDRSSWVAANAGSGKTRVLTNRVARLLLTGTEPQRILCLTYTKAAAAEMQTRLFQTLGTWAMLDDAELRKALDDLGTTESHLTPDALARARTLFARALETPGGLKIQTIHAFCEALLRRFPVEAGVAPQFTVLDDRQSRALREEILDRLAETHPEHLAGLANFLPGDDPDPILCEIGSNRAAFEAPFDPECLATALGTNPDDSLEAILARTLAPADLANLRALGPLLAASGSSDQKAGKKLAAALLGAPAEMLTALEDILLTGASAREPFTAKLGKFPTKGIRSGHPKLCAALDTLMMRVEAARSERIRLAAFARSAALNRFARAWLQFLGARKASQGVLDFDDMIDRTCRLLSDSSLSAWVLWRLDGGLDHVLVDEAQDTSPAQWQVVRAISDEFFTGSSAREIDRTIFVVGDEKQSIYSFQGADPTAFGNMRQHFEARLSNMEQELQHCDLIHSFRSALPILSLVDAVFHGPAGSGLENPVEHRPFDATRPGRVEIWPFLPRPEKPEEPPWHLPVDSVAPDDPVERLATRIAECIAGWLAHGEVLPGPDPAPIRAGDVMILVQRRNALFHAIIRALKRAGVPVAGADVLRIGAELAVKDLMACLRVAATPSDDLSLAALLRSPLCGISEEALFDLAHGRHSLLWRELRESAASDLAEARALVSDLLDQADFLRPFEVLERVLLRHDGRRRLIARLGAEAEDGIDALLDQALAYERTAPPTLTGFLAWMDHGDMQVKRRAEEAADLVRVMTVHGAKGLESPIVILPDTVERPEGRNAPDILTTGNGMALWRVRSEEAPEILQEAELMRREKARAENMRLLYVALTRAETWLIVCGAGTQPKSDGASWYALTRAAMETLAVERQSNGPDPTEGETLLLTHNWTKGPRATPARPLSAAAALPDWTSRPARGETSAPVEILSPSRLGGAHALPPMAGAPVEAEDALRARGDAVHLLLERITEVSPADRPALARAVVPEALGNPADILAEVERILARPDLGFLFGPGALAEAEIVAPLNNGSGTRLQGRIDRLIIAPDRILAVDFKSNLMIPGTPAAIPDGILRQLGAYDAALTQVWPQRPVETAILWTRSAALMPVPPALVRAAFARARGTGRSLNRQRTA